MALSNLAPSPSPNNAPCRPGQSADTTLTSVTQQEATWLSQPYQIFSRPLNRSGLANDDILERFVAYLRTEKGLGSANPRTHQNLPRRLQGVKAELCVSRGKRQVERTESRHLFFRLTAVVLNG